MAVPAGRYLDLTTFNDKSVACISHRQPSANACHGAFLRALSFVFLMQVGEWVHLGGPIFFLLHGRNNIYSSVVFKEK